MANGKHLTVAQAAVKLFMTGTVAEARQILEIGQAIVEQRESVPALPGLAAVRPPRAKPGPKPRVQPPVDAPIGSLDERQVTGEQAPRRRGRPARAAAGPQGIVPPPAASTAQDTPAAHRRRRPAVAAETTEPQQSVQPPETLTGGTASAAPANELPPQGEPGEDEV